MSEELEPQQRALTATNRLASSFLRRRWPEFAVEFILIIVGILTALTIDGMAQDRKDRETETTYLELLREKHAHHRKGVPGCNIHRRSVWRRSAVGGDAE